MSHTRLLQTLPSWTRTVVSGVLCAALAAGCAPSPPADEPGPPPADLAVAAPDAAPLPDLSAPDQMSSALARLYLTGAFDGGRSPYQSWVSTLQFARDFKEDVGREIHLTYFITTAHYDLNVTGSTVGRAQSRDEILVRWALTQQAANEGHEIANHTVRHADGGMWTEEQWRKELTEFHEHVRKNLFEPIYDDSGEPVFPRWRPAAGAPPGEVGAACTADDDCYGGLSCAHVTPQRGFCTQPCNRDLKCPHGTICGWPSSTGSETDICLPRPELPIRHQGQELFAADGTPNLSHPALRAYQVVGFRAPYLAYNDAMFKVLGELGYLYDTSLVLAPAPPSRFKGLLQFGLMKYAGTQTIPMDYNYLILTKPDGAPLDPDGKIMEKDYRVSMVSAYQASGRVAWNVGHHLTPYNNGAYFDTFRRTFRFAGRGCLDYLGNKRCDSVAFPSFRELAQRLRDSGMLPTLREAARLDRASLSAAGHAPSCGCGRAAGGS